MPSSILNLEINIYILYNSFFVFILDIPEQIKSIFWILIALNFNICLEIFINLKDAIK
jgi:hypothetical protein